MCQASKYWWHVTVCMQDAMHFRSDYMSSPNAEPHTWSRLFKSSRFNSKYQIFRFYKKFPVVQRYALRFIQFAQNLRVNFLDGLWFVFPIVWRDERKNSSFNFTQTEPTKKVLKFYFSRCWRYGTFSGSGTYVFEVFGQQKSMSETSLWLTSRFEGRTQYAFSPVTITESSSSVAALQ